MKYFKKIEFGIIFIIFLAHLNYRANDIRNNEQIIIEKIENIIFRRAINNDEYFIIMLINILSVLSCCWGVIFCLLSTSTFRRIYILYNIFCNYSMIFENIDKKTLFLFFSLFLYFMKKKIKILFLMLYMNILEVKKIGDMSVKTVVERKLDKKK